MVWIAAASYRMGDSKNESEDWMESAQPAHRVELDGFYMDAYEVTVGQYKKFLSETGHSALPDWVSKSHRRIAIRWWGLAGMMRRLTVCGQASDCQRKRNGSMRPEGD